MPDINNFSSEQLIKMIGVRLKQLRKSKNLSRVDLARVSRVGPNTVNDLGTENSPNITLKILIRLLKALDSLDLLNALVFSEENIEVEEPQDEEESISFRVTFKGEIEVRADIDGELKRFYIEPTSPEYEKAVEKALNSLTPQEKEDLVRIHDKE